MKKILVIIIIVIIAISGFFIYSNAKAKTSEDAKETSRIESEIDYLDTKITSLINTLNGIELQNYKVTVSKTKEEKTDTSGQERRKRRGKRRG